MLNFQGAYMKTGRRLTPPLPMGRPMSARPAAGAAGLAPAAAWRPSALRVYYTLKVTSWPGFFRLRGVSRNYELTFSDSAQ